ncbi:protein serine/threonine phosphatase [Caldithrix abyssi DSM 13497]|uniref:Protein serine/threonine phosphatase n=1 Tax=Caldithrix abyssi DSM 13497 TaxID=880073 RepID=H1XNV6_CALAY|nr:Stp1/IreP family PP2C-type Ser/Thr phosphatase [Caldithrix abyssi]APF19792.1 Serine/threonine protein phosphatase PrpC [Caldithrix abyssi DSM 13497]EHO39896.1 protein serine/threonine phosphatase [Caldithrix abyssi DSM 13497]
MVKNYELFNISDVGKRRQNNEDYYAAFQNEGWLLLVLCDGMGGVEGGEIASQLAVKAIGEYFKKKFNEPISFFVNSVKFANEVIRKRSAQKQHLAEMGTTLVAVLFNGKEIFYAHVGDSRLYLFRDKKLIQLTNDHTYVSELVKRGVLSNSQATNHQYKNRISRCIGYLNSEPEIASSPVPVKEGDIFLLCSDGLTDMVSDEKIAQILNSTSNLDKTAQKLIREANKNGGRDNITIQLLKIKDPASIRGKNLSGQPKKNKKKWVVILSALSVLIVTGLFFTLYQKSLIKRVVSKSKTVISPIMTNDNSNKILNDRGSEKNKEKILNIGEFHSLLFLPPSRKEREAFLHSIRIKLDTIKIHTLYYPKNEPIAIQKSDGRFKLMVSAGTPGDSLTDEASKIKFLQDLGFDKLFGEDSTSAQPDTSVEKQVKQTEQK